MKSQKMEAELREPAVYLVPGSRWGFVLWSDVMRIVAHPSRFGVDLLKIVIEQLQPKSLEMRDIQSAAFAWHLLPDGKSFRLSGSSASRSTAIMHTDSRMLVPAGFARLVRDSFEEKVAPHVPEIPGEHFLD